MPTTATAPTVTDHLAEPLRLGAPDVHGALAVFPLFGPAPAQDYVAFAQAGPGVVVKELDGGASVNDLLVLNHAERPVLLYEGEEVLGAQQNRTFDVSVLVGAGSRLTVPVSCVEAGRWDGARADESFAPAPQAAYPQLRRRKNLAASANVTAGMAPRAVQQEVWSEVAARGIDLAVDSPTSAMHDVFVSRRGALDGASRAIELHDGQTGALALIGGAPVVLDHVSRPEVFAALHRPLVQGYALDALDGVDTPVDEGVALEFLSRVLGARTSQSDGIGLGRDLRFGDTRVSGAGLAAGDELVQLTAFAADAPGPTRIRRPSRRRA